MIYSESSTHVVHEIGVVIDCGQRQNDKLYLLLTSFEGNRSDHRHRGTYIIRDIVGTPFHIQNYGTPSFQVNFILPVPCRPILLFLASSIFPVSDIPDNLLHLVVDNTKRLPAKFMKEINALGHSSRSSWTAAKRYAVASLPIPMRPSDSG